MLKKYYARSHISQRNSIMQLDDYLKPKHQTKRTKSQGNYNNLTKTSEKSLKSLIKYKKKTTPLEVTKTKTKSIIKTRINKTGPRSSYVNPKNIIMKPKNSNFKQKKISKIKSISNSNQSLSESYDSLLQQFNCDSNLRLSFKKLVKLEKLSLKKTFCLKKSYISNNLLVNSYFNPKSSFSK